MNRYRIDLSGETVGLDFDIERHTFTLPALGTLLTHSKSTTLLDFKLYPQMILGRRVGDHVS